MAHRADRRSPRIANGPESLSPEAPSMHPEVVMNRMSRSLRSTLVALSLALGAAAFVTPLRADAAAAPAAGASTYLKAKHEKVNAILKSKDADKDKKVEDELNTLIDYDQMAKDALGDAWNDPKRTDAERTQFEDLLKQLIQKNYKKRLSQTLDYAINYKGEDAGKDGAVIVHTEAQNVTDKREAPTQIDYVMKKSASGSYIVVDLIPEGSSMIKTYHKEFTKVISKDGWDAMIKKMKDKLAKS
jgi:phospholipid transport system substrate-binding protein